MITFSTPATATALTTLAAVKLELGITNNASDTLLTGYIDDVSASFAKVCSRENFGAATAVETLRPRTTTCRPLWLSHWPVTSINSVVEDGVTLTAADYELDSGRKLWRLDGSDNRSLWPAVKLVITYVGGYSLPSGAPRNLAKACIDVVHQRWSAQKRDPALKATEQPGLGRSEFWVGSIVDDCVEQVLLDYTNVFFG